MKGIGASERKHIEDVMTTVKKLISCSEEQIAVLHANADDLDSFEVEFIDMLSGPDRKEVRAVKNFF